MVDILSKASLAEVTTRSSSHEVVRYLWGLPEVDKLAENKAGETMLHSAAGSGKLDVVQFVCDQIDTDEKLSTLLISTCCKQQTALHKAAENGDVDTCF